MGNSQAREREPTTRENRKEHKRAKKHAAAAERAAAKAAAKRSRKRQRKTTVESNRFTTPHAAQADPSFTERLAKMWGRPIGPGTSRDAVRLAARLDVEHPAGTVAKEPGPSAKGEGASEGGHTERAEIALIDGLANIAALLGGGESATVAALARGYSPDEFTSPDRAMAGAQVFDVLGGDGSPVVRAAKCLHQKFVLEAMGELVVGDSAPLRGHMCADDRSQQGWRIRFETATRSPPPEPAATAATGGAAGGGVETVVVVRLDRPDLATSFGLAIADMSGGQLCIWQIKAGSPAAATALEDGDILVAVDGISVSDGSDSCHDDVVGMLAESTSVDLTVRRRHVSCIAGKPPPSTSTAGTGGGQVVTIAPTPTSTATEAAGDAEANADGGDAAGGVIANGPGGIAADAAPSCAPPVSCIRVVHARRDRLVVMPKPGAAGPPPLVYVRWELAMRFSPQMRAMEHAELKIVGVDIALGGDRALLPPPVNTLIDAIGNGVNVV